MLKRIFSNVVTRVAVGLILAALFAMFGSSKAHAADQGQAYAECTAKGLYMVEQANAAGPGGAYECVHDAPVPPATTGSYSCHYSHPINGPGWINCSAPFTWGYTGSCQGRVEETSWSAATAVCYQGCKYFGYTEGSVTFFSTCNDTDPVPDGATCGAGSYSVCTSADVPEPMVDTDGDGVPDEEDAFPNDPTETADSDGDGVGDNADFSPDDPTDGSDTPGEEDGDDEGDNQASGGGTCDAPPSCKGDGIACAQLFQQWKIRCDTTAQGKVTGGDVQDCDATIVVQSPDPVANAQLAVLRKIACNAGTGTPGGSTGDANGNGVADALEGEGSSGESPETPDAMDFDIGINPDMLDQENIFGGGTCPNAPSFTIWTVTISPSSMPYWCQMMAIARALILIFGMWTACQILMGRII